MGEKRIVPKRRFSEFNEGWKTKKLIECIDYIKGFAFPSRIYKNEGIRLIRVTDLGTNKIITHNEKIFIDKIHGKKYKSYTLSAGDIIVTTVGSKAELKESAVGRPILVQKHNEGLLNQNLVKLSIINGYNSYFIYGNLLKKGYSSYVKSIERGNANQANITIDDLWQFGIKISSLEEQQKIGNFFNMLDERIANQERKIAKVKALKAAYLTEMFPQEGETVPKRRFKGFEGEWDVRELSDIAYKAVDNRGKTPPLNRRGIHPIIEVIALGGRNPNYSDVEKYIDEFTYNYFLRDYVKENDILFSTVGRIGVVSMMDSNKYATIAQNIVGFRAKKNYCPSFLYVLFSNKLNFKKVNKIVMGAVQPSVKVSQLIKLNYLISSNFDEQQKIGTFFKNLDNQITTEESKLEKLKRMKQAYLEEMFV